ncbi:hypothetical protein D3C72_2548370 [compost metagenome]
MTVAPISRQTIITIPALISFSATPSALRPRYSTSAEGTKKIRLPICRLNPNWPKKSVRMLPLPVM